MSHTLVVCCNIERSDHVHIPFHFRLTFLLHPVQGARVAAGKSDFVCGELDNLTLHYVSSVSLAYK